jgi:peptide chain release factor 2
LLSCGGIFDWDASNARLLELNAKAEDPDLWQDAARAQELMRERDQLATSLGKLTHFQNRLDDTLELLKMAEEEGEDELLLEAEENLFTLQKEARRLQIESLLSGEADGNDCFLEVHAGAGGTEAQDWAEMLQRMYARWAEAHGYKLEWIEESAGEEAGIKSCTVRIKGFQAFGWLKTECGVHRLVRISPYDTNARRHTSFASVGIYPVVDDTIDIAIEEKDLRIDTYRSSGAGGQHVNTTDSAVRITHLPTNIAVQCQNERSQHKNKAQAMSMLKSRLYERELQAREDAARATNAQKSEIGWGHQIRSYVLHPYQMVKDLRTGVERGNAQGVLDGDLDAYLEAALAARLGEEA